MTEIASLQSDDGQCAGRGTENPVKMRHVLEIAFGQQKPQQPWAPLQSAL